MATNPRNKISNRPTIKAAQQPLPRQIIKAIKSPVKPQMPTATAQDLQRLYAASNMAMANQVQNRPPMQATANYGQGTLVAPNQPTPAMSNFNSYGFDKGLVDYLNNQRERSTYDAGISYNYDPVTQTFTGNTMGGPVTMNLAQMQAEAQNYALRPVFNKNNPDVAAQAGVMQNTSTQRPVQGGFGQPLVPYAPNLPNYQNTQPSSGIQQLQSQLGMQSQQNFGSMPNYNQQGLGGMGQSPYQANPMMGGNMATPYNSGNPTMGNNTQAQPFGQTMAQAGFVPVGGYDPQNTSYGSFGAIQQPMGGFGNFGSLI
jgi:hypothetical protein